MHSNNIWVARFSLCSRARFSMRVYGAIWLGILWSRMLLGMKVSADDSSARAIGWQDMIGS